MKMSLKATGAGMIIDFFLAAWAGWETGSVAAFGLLMLLGWFFTRPERPFFSGLLRLALLALGIPALFSLFGGRGDCDV
jgi:hypothetical protein